jgi:hypothetical protein
MRFWDKLKTTDPKHTKAVTFGPRKFTSIDAHWQLQRMTEVFGPVGEGWTYAAKHSIERIADTMVLAVCDVEIMWKPDADATSRAYGPIRGTCEIWSQATYKGDLLWEKDGKPKMRLDDDAPKKAMTDALTKGLSHLGVSADVFLGLYDDNKYVQSLKNGLPPTSAAIENVDEGDRHLVKNGETRSQYEVDKRKAAEQFVSDALKTFDTMTGAPAVSDWYNTARSPKGRTTNRDAVERLRETFPDLHTKLETAADEVRLRNGARLQ